MPSTPRGRSVFLVLLVAALSVLPTRGAWAHSALISSNPSSGSSISALPELIELRFNDTLSELSPALIVRRDNTTVAVLEPRVDGKSLLADPPIDVLPDSSYQLVWRIVSEDGHPLSGVIPFRIGGDQAPATEAPDAAQAPPQSSTSNALAITLGIVPVAVLAVFLVRRRLTRPDITKENS